MKGKVFIVILLLCVANIAHATVWYVHPDSALNSIQAGIDLCSTGDTVLVAPGTYIENINFYGKAIAVTSELGPDTTIIDGGTPTNPDTASVVCFVSGEDTSSVLDGFTLMNGSGIFDPDYDRLGGGIYCRDYSSPTITNNTITDNTAYFGGGIICGVYCSPIVTGNTISRNIAVIGGGGIICVEYCSPTITGNTIDSNTAWWGGGIGLYDNASPYIKDNAIEGGTASRGAGIACWPNCSPTITSNTITDNVASTWGGGIYCIDNSSPSIDSNTISNNTGDGVYCEFGSNPNIHYNDIFDNSGYGVCNVYPSDTINAEDNWWGDPSGPGGFGPGTGDSVSDYVDFTPWLENPFGIVEEKITPIQSNNYGATIFAGPLQLPEGKKCRVFDITGRVVAPDKIQPGIYFIEVEGTITQKVVKIR